MSDIKKAVREMAGAMSADERIFIFMEGVKFAMEQMKAAAAAKEAITNGAQEHY